MTVSIDLSDEFRKDPAHKALKKAVQSAGFGFFFVFKKYNLDDIVQDIEQGERCWVVINNFWSYPPVVLTGDAETVCRFYMHEFKLPDGPVTILKDITDEARDYLGYV